MSPKETTVLTRAGRIGFFLAAAVSLVMAVLPHPPSMPGQPSDKILHVLAFATLGSLAALAFPKPSILALFAGLTAFGATIELVQLVPVLNRDSEWADLFADMAAALTSLLVARALMAWHFRRK